MPYYSSNILRVLYSDVKEIADVLGDDNYLTVKGIRRLGRRCLYKKSAEVALEVTSKTSIHAVTTEGIVSGGGGDKDVEPAIKVLRSLYTQTDSIPGNIPQAPMTFFQRNVGVITAHAKNIQLKRQKRLDKVARVGDVRNSSTSDDEADVPQATFTTPDKLPLCAAIEEATNKNAENPVPKLKLVPAWKQDIIRREEKQKVRDSEWLRVSSPEEGTTDDMEAIQAEGFAKLKQTSLNSYSHSLATSMSLLVYVSAIGGRWPFCSYDHTDKWRKHELRKLSWAYLLFVITSLLHFLISVISMMNLVRLAYAKNRQSVSRTAYVQVERLEFDKYWHFAFWTYIMACFVMFWNIMIVVEGGRFLSELMSRWSLAVAGLHYNPILRIRRRICWWTFGYVLYATGLIVLFQTETVPAVPGTATVLGFLLLRGIKPNVRFSSHFYWVRLFGLIYHLYTVYAAKVAMLFLITYAKILENTARNWNLRFALRFGMLGRKKKGQKDYQIIAYRVQIPMEKLLVEHRVLTAFCRHTSFIYHTILNFYILTKGTEMVLFIYRSLFYLIFPDTIQFNETHFDIKETGESIAYKDSDAQKMMSCFIVTGTIIFGWLVTCVNISDCGDAIMNGYGFVRRHGLVFCRGAKERLAIQSLTFQYSPVIEYYMQIGTPFKRSFVSGLFTWILVFSLGLLSFMPFQLQKEAISYCKTDPVTGEVSCSSVTLSNIKSAVVNRITAKPTITTTQPATHTIPTTSVITTLSTNSVVTRTRAASYTSRTVSPTITATNETTHPLTILATTTTTPATTNTATITNTPKTTTTPTTKNTPKTTSTTTPTTTTTIPTTTTTTITPKTTSTTTTSTTTTTPTTTTITPKTTYTTTTPTTTIITPKTTSRTPTPTTTSTTTTPTTTPTTTTTTPTTTSTTTITPETAFTTTTPTTTTTTPTTTTTTPTTTITTPTTTTTTPTTTTTTPTTTTTTPTTTTSATTTTTFPTITTSQLSEACNTTWRDNMGNEIPTKVLTNQLSACNHEGRRIQSYPGGYCARQFHGRPYTYASYPLRNCLATTFPVSKTDDCGNLDYEKGVSKKLISILGYVNLPSGLYFFRICASCFDYSFLGNSDSLKYCHMQSQEQAIKACGKLPGRISDKFSVKDPHFTTKNVICPTSSYVSKRYRCKVETKWKTAYGFSKSAAAFVLTPPAHLPLNPSEPILPFIDTMSCYEREKIFGVLIHPHPYGYGYPDDLVSSTGFTSEPISKMWRDSCGNLPHIARGLERLEPVVLQMDYIGLVIILYAGHIPASFPQGILNFKFLYHGKDKLHYFRRSAGT